MKTIKSRGPFAQYEDTTWGIDTKVKIGDSFQHFKKKGYATLSAAKADFERAKAEFIAGRSLHKSSVMLFDDLLDEYTKMRRITVNATTLSCDASVFNVYLLPAFGKTLLKDCINPDSIQAWYDALIADVRVSANKKSKVITRVKDLLKFAYMRKFIGAETYQDCDVLLYPVKCKRASATERVVWTKEEEADFLSVIKDAKDLVMFKLFLACGARLGEFLGLQPKCFERERKRLKICQQALNIPGEGTILTDKLKTHDSYRTVMLTDDVAHELADYIDGLGLKDDDFLFFDREKGKPMSRSTFRRRLYRYCDLAKVRRINPHASRHIQATRLAGVCKTGEEIEAAARRLGHSPEMFMNTYARHANDKTEEALIERLAKA